MNRREPIDRSAAGRGAASELASEPASLASDLRAALAIAAKDLRHETRSRAATVATLFFSGVTLVVLAFAVGSDPEVLRRSAPGALWVALAFAGVISAAQSYQNEQADGAFDQLLLYPVPRAAIFVGKLIANWALMALLGALLLPTVAVLYGVPLGGAGVAGALLLAAAVALGTLGFAVIATFYAALTANLQARESLLPVLMFPVVVPILLAAVRATQAIVQSGNADAAGGWVQLIGGFDLAYLVLTTALFRFVVEE